MLFVRKDTSPGIFWVWFPGVDRVLNIGLLSQCLGDFSADMDEFTAVFLRCGCGGVQPV